MRKLQTSASSPAKHVISFLGDSYTLNYTTGCTHDQFGPYQCAKVLNAAGASVKARNFGISGNTTAQMVARMTCLTQYEVPDIAVIYGGTNDKTTLNSTVQASPSPTTSVFSVASGKGANFPAGSYLMVNGVSVGKIASVATDAITLATPMSAPPTAGQTVAIDTQANLTAIGNFLKAAGCSRIVFVGLHYINWSANGDTLATPLSDRAAIRTLIQNAVTAVGTGAVYCDFYNFLRSRIVGGTDTQGSFSWHDYDQDTHFNAYGGSLYGQCVAATIQAQTGWLAALK